MEYITLMGSEQVQSAARQIKEAATAMEAVAGSMQYTMMQQQRFMDDWLMRLSDVLQPRS